MEPIFPLFQRPVFAHRLFKFLCDEVLVPHIEAMRREVGMPDLLMDGRDAWASPPLVTLDMMDEYVCSLLDIPPVFTLHCLLS